MAVFAMAVDRQIALTRELDIDDSPPPKAQQQNDSAAPADVPTA